MEGKGGGETAAYLQIHIQESHSKLLYMLKITASPCLLQSMILAGFSFAFNSYI